jgi:hypothetical protein
VDPTILLVILGLTVVLFFACLINTGAGEPVAAGAHDHGHGDASHGHDDDLPHGQPGEVAHPGEH